jgi:hypothetical protein
MTYTDDRHLAEQRREIKRLEELVRAVAMYGQAFIYEPPGGERVTLNPMYVTVVLAADHLTEVERLTAANADLTDRLDRTLHELREVAGERDALHSWAGLMSLLDEHYPDSTYPTLPDRKGRDAGPRIISLIRTVDVLRDEAAAANAALADVSDLLDEARTERDAARAEIAALLNAITHSTDRHADCEDRCSLIDEIGVVVDDYRKTTAPAEVQP